MSGRSSRSRGPSRRGFLTAGGALVAGATLGTAGCSPPPREITVKMTIPDPRRKLPGGDVELRVMDSGDTKEHFWVNFAAAYEKKHSHITVAYDGLPWPRIEEVAPLGIRNGTAHDILQLPPATLPLPQAVRQGWVAPLDEVIPDYQRWWRSFPEGTFAEGVQIFDGRIYSVPLASEQRHQALLHYNRELMEDAGYDPEAEPLTWDGFRQAARRITKRGKGQAYGVILEAGQTDRLSRIVSYLAASAGVPSVDYAPGFMDARTGEFVYTEDAVVEAIEVLLALRDDGSVFPGSNSLLAPECWPRVLRGNAGMVLAGPWVAETWERESPDFDFGVTRSPVAGPGGFTANYPVFGTDGVVVFAGSKLKVVAGDVLSFATSVAGQTAWGKSVGAGNPPIITAARQALRASAGRRTRTCLDLAEEMRTRPEAVIRNPEVVAVERRLKPLTPGFGQVIQAAFLGETDDLRGALRGLRDRSDRQLDEAIEAARKDGAKVSREDFVFPNWDPGRNYSTADYEAL